MKDVNWDICMPCELKMMTAQFHQYFLIEKNSKRILYGTYCRLHLVRYERKVKEFIAVIANTYAKLFTAKCYW